MLGCEQTIWPPIPNQPELQLELDFTRMASARVLGESRKSAITAVGESFEEFQACFNLSQVCERIRKSVREGILALGLGA
jgi:hypothetical protein